MHVLRCYVGSHVSFRATMPTLGYVGGLAEPRFRRCGQGYLPWTSTEMESLLMSFVLKCMPRSYLLGYLGGEQIFSGQI